MKVFIFIVLVLCLAVNLASADWYIFDGATNRAIARINYLPDEADLDSRNEFAFEVDDTIQIPLKDAEFQNNKVKVRVKSQAEKNAIQDMEEENAEMAEIYHIMFREAYKKAVDDGHIFQKMNRHVDDVDGEKNKVNKKKGDFNAAKVKLMGLGLTEDEADSLR